MSLIADSVTPRAKPARHPAQDLPPSPADMERALRRFQSAKTATAFTMIGNPDAYLKTTDKGDRYRWGGYKSLLRLQHHLSVYVAHVILKAPQRHLAAALGIDRREIARSIEFVEDARSAPLFEAALAHCEATCPRDP